MAVFANLARRGKSAFDKPQPEDHPDVEQQVIAELDEAGIVSERFRLFENGEVPTKLRAAQHRWIFQRAWYYWVAEGPGIPPTVAAEFDKEWGKQVRAQGDCACRGPEFWDEGFGTGMYHIDTQEGLNAFVKLLASIHEPQPSS